MTLARELRIGDAERDAAVTALGEHYAAGRLTRQEYDERSDLALRARTDSDVRHLFVDLPRLKDRRGPVAASGAPAKRSLMWRPVPAAPMLAVFVLVMAVTTEAWWLLFVVWWLFFCAGRRRHWR
jgi:hypothetical protein